MRPHETPSATSWCSTRRVVALAAACIALTGCGGGSEGTGTSASDTANQRAQALLARMTQDEKLLLVHGSGFPLLQGSDASGRVAGIERLGIPELRYRDSGSGIAIDNIGATAFPSTLAMAASWDTDTLGEVAARIAVEARSLGFGSVLGGGANLAREPRNGRTFEYLGEDPVLAGEMMISRTAATQAQGVISTIKHFAGNEQETNRYTSNSVIDERTLRELYLLPFEMTVVRAQPGSVMCAYNLLNNEKTCENKSLLTYTLKDEWGFEGVVQSDWFAAINNTVAAANAGLDQEQPGSGDDCASAPSFIPCFSYFGSALRAAISAGTVAQSRLDNMVSRYLGTLFRHGVMDNPPPAPTARARLDTTVGEPIALKMAERSMVLLKNSTPAGDVANALPLQPRAGQRLVVIGGHADVAVMGGGGSAQAPYRDAPVSPVACLTPGAVDPQIHTFSMCAPWQPSSPLAALRAQWPGVQVDYVDGSDASAAAAAAASSDVAIVFATQYLMEAVDLPDLTLPNNISDPANQSYDQNALIAAVAAAAPRTVVVLQTGTAVTMPWLDNVHSVLQAWYPGVRGGEAIARVLAGVTNPSGKLPMTFPRSTGDLPQAAISASDLNVVYREGLKMGYRWYDAQGITPLFPFGHGLSYTQFAYAGLGATQAANGDVVVRFTLRNTGSRAGAEVAQVYAELPANAGAPPQRLVAFRRVELAAGASQVVELTVPAARLAVWDNAWRVLAGTHRLKVGGSSRTNEALTTTLNLTARSVTHAQ